MCTLASEGTLPPLLLLYVVRSFAKRERDHRWTYFVSYFCFCFSKRLKRNPLNSGVRVLLQIKPRRGGIIESGGWATITQPVVVGRGLIHGHLRMSSCTLGTINTLKPLGPNFRYFWYSRLPGDFYLQQRFVKWCNNMTLRLKCLARFFQHHSKSNANGT